jgi:hypothetical protein
MFLIFFLAFRPTSGIINQVIIFLYRQRAS